MSFGLFLSLQVGSYASLPVCPTFCCELFDIRFTDPGHFSYQSAYIKTYLCHIEWLRTFFTLHCYISFSWIGFFLCDPKPSGWAIFPMHDNLAKVQNLIVYHPWSSLKICPNMKRKFYIFAWRNLCLHNDMMHFNSNFSWLQEYTSSPL